MNRQERERQFAQARIYPVITPAFCAGRDPLQVAAELTAAGARVLQLRAKPTSDREFLILALRFREITARSDCLLIIDDRPDIALLSQADGVHVGQDDLPVHAVRRLLPDGLVGVSCHDADEISAAQAEDISYLNIGPVFSTQTKQNPMPPLGVQRLAELAQPVRVPFSVMGGIKEDHIPELRNAGARILAMVTQLTQAPSPGAVFARLYEAMNPDK